MKVAVVHPYAVHAKAVGGTTRVYAFVRHLAAAGHDVTVLAHSTGLPEADRAAVEDLAGFGVGQRLFPLPKPSLLRRVPWTFGPTPYFVHRNRNAALEGALAAFAPDVVHVEHGYLAPLLGRIGRRAACVLAEQETMSLAIRRLRATTGRSPYEWFLTSQYRKVVAFERRAFARYDRIWAITATEASYLSEITSRRIEVVPHVVDTRLFAPSPEPAVGAGLLFVGNYAHRPNQHGVLWFLGQAWPLVRAAVPAARLDVVGPGLVGAGRERLERAGCRVLGRVDDLAGAYRSAAVFVNPIRSGGGMRGKVLEAFACGCAVVSTAMGLEGVDARDGDHCLVADTPSGFADAVARYLRSPALRRKHGLAARALAESEYDPRRVFPRLEAGLAAAIDERRRATA